jgi:large subunit ribosomal protein L17
MVNNLLTDLFRHEQITTTVEKAKAIRPLAERLVTLAKRGHLHARRQVLKVIRDAGVVAKMFDSIAARFSDRHGGYTRIIRDGHRPGDAAQLALMELMDRPSPEGRSGPEKRKPG